MSRARWRRGRSATDSQSLRTGPRRGRTATGRSRVAAWRHDRTGLPAGGCHRGVGDDGRGRQGEGAQSGRQVGDRLRRRRAGLPHAGLHRRGGRAGLPGPALAPLHARGRPAGAPGGDRGEDAAGLRSPGLRRPGPRHERGQAGGLRGVRGPAGPRRRSAGHRAVLDDLPRSGAARGRGPRGGADRRGQRLPGHRGAARGGQDPAYQGPALRLPLQPHRRGLPARPGGGHRAVGAGQRPVGPDRRDLRAPRLRRCPVLLRPDAGPGARGPVRGGQRRRQDLRHDRVAGGMDARPDATS